MFKDSREIMYYNMLRLALMTNARLKNTVSDLWDPCGLTTAIIDASGNDFFIRLVRHLVCATLQLPIVCLVSCHVKAAKKI